MHEHATACAFSAITRRGGSVPPRATARHALSRRSHRFSPDPADALCGRQGRHEPALVGPIPTVRGVAPAFRDGASGRDATEME